MPHQAAYCLECLSESCVHIAPRPVYLTPRQLEVVNLVKLGCSNRRIAEKLGLSCGTVKIYMNKIFEKLPAVTNRTELAIWALRRGEEKP